MIKHMIGYTQSEQHIYAKLAEFKNKHQGKFYRETGGKEKIRRDINLLFLDSVFIDLLKESDLSFVQTIQCNGIQTIVFSLDASDGQIESFYPLTFLSEKKEKDFSLIENKKPSEIKKIIDFAKKESLCTIFGIVD